MYNILIVDDEKEIIDLLRLYLEQDGINIYEAYDGRMGYEVFKNYKIDLAIIDIMMPHINGYELMKKVKSSISEGGDIPVIFLTAKDALDDKILGLNMGADDYITKPFEPMEVVARVKARLRRLSDKAATEKEVQVGNLTLKTQECEVTDGERKVTLTKAEYLVLELFMKNLGRVFTKEQIYEAGWKEAYAVDDNTIRVIISRLRDKIGEERITTIRGLGYRMEKQKY